MPEQAGNCGHQRSATDTTNGLRSGQVQVDPQVAPKTHAACKRRGQGEDSIYWDESKNRYVGAVSLGFRPAGTRLRKKVTGQTKTEVRAGGHLKVFPCRLT